MQRKAGFRAREPFPVRWAAVLAAIAGLVGVAAFPRFGIWPLAAVSMAGFSLAVRGRRARTGAWLGYLYGWAFFGPLLVWTGTFVGPVWLLLPFAEAAFFALLGAALPTLLRQRGAPLWIACAWVGDEALRDRLPFGGFPWGRWAFSQADSPLRWFAAIGGAPLVTGVVALGGALLAAAVLHVRRLRVAPQASLRRFRVAPQASLWRLRVAPQASLWRLRIAPQASLREHRPVTALVGLGALLAVPASGLLAGVLLTPGPATHSQVIALVQGSTPDRGLEFNARRRQVLDNHVNETLKLAAAVKAGTAAQPTLVVWPENSSDIDPLVNPDAAAQINRAAQTVGVPILVGAVLDGPGPTHVSNVGILWSPTTGPGARYVKRHPVPFAEYLPLRGLATAISSKAKLIAFDMYAGSGNGLLSGGPMPIGDVICFEVAYDGLVRSSVRAGAQVLVVQTNNATFGHSAESYQQLAMSQVRAVENGRSVIQVSTVGKSAIIGADGRVRAETGQLFTAGYLSMPVPLYTSTTLATRLGWWPELAMSLLAVGALGWSVPTAVRSRRTRATPRHDPSADNEELVPA